MHRCVGALTVYLKKYAHGFCFAVLCCGYTLTDFPISIRLTSLALWQSDDCPSASKATLMNMDKYFMWIHYERLHNHNKANHNKTVCIFLGIYCTDCWFRWWLVACWAQNNYMTYMFSLRHVWYCPASNIYLCMCTDKSAYNSTVIYEYNALEDVAYLENHMDYRAIIWPSSGYHPAAIAQVTRLRP